MHEEERHTASKAGGPRRIHVIPVKDHRPRQGKKKKKIKEVGTGK